MYKQSKNQVPRYIKFLTKIEKAFFNIYSGCLGFKLLPWLLGTLSTTSGYFGGKNWESATHVENVAPVSYKYSLSMVVTKIPGYATAFSREVSGYLKDIPVDGLGQV